MALPEWDGMRKSEADCLARLAVSRNVVLIRRPNDRPFATGISQTSHATRAMERPKATQVPPGSLIADHLPGANFYDAWSIDLVDDGRSALRLFMQSLAATPAWVERCMALRNRAAVLVGLKDLGPLSAVDPAGAESANRPGDRVGIFTLVQNTFAETLLGDRDKHLDVVLSVHRRACGTGRVLVTVTTVVRVHNLLGHLYMIPVRPLHRRIAPAVLASLAR